MMNYIKKVFGFVGAVVVIVLLVTGSISIVKYIVNLSEGEEYPEYTRPDEEHHNIELSRYDIETELKDISELMTYEYNYNGIASITDYRQTLIFGWDVPLTGHEIKLTYAGTIKVGYDLDSIDVDVDNDRRVITIALGQQIIENNLPEESVETIEKNNIVNPIRSDEVTNRLADIKSEEYSAAIAEGIEGKAEENIKQIIENKMSMFEGYTVRFI